MFISLQDKKKGNKAPNLGLATFLFLPNFFSQFFIGFCYFLVIVSHTNFWDYFFFFFFFLTYFAKTKLNLTIK